MTNYRMNGLTLVKLKRTLKQLGGVIMLAAATHLAAAQGQPASGAQTSEAEYAWYSNGRYAYALPYPSKLLFPQGESDSGGGQDFLSSDKKTSLGVWSDFTPEVLNETLEDECKQDVAGEPGSHPNRKVTYTALHGNWCIVSGTDGDNIFYQKRYVVGGKAVVFLITYPANQRKTWDKVVAYISRKFIPGPADPYEPDDPPPQTK